MAPQKDITLCKSISNNLREFRTKNYPGHGGMTQCAKDFGIAVTSWNGWEKGRYIPSDAYQRKLASFMGISISALRGELSKNDAILTPTANDMIKLKELHVVLRELQIRMDDHFGSALIGEISPEQIGGMLKAIISAMDDVEMKMGIKDEEADAG